MSLFSLLKMKQPSPNSTPPAQKAQMPKLTHCSPQLISSATIHTQLRLLLSRQKWDSQAQDACDLEQVSTINFSGFTGSVLPTALKSWFWKLKSFPEFQLLNPTEVAKCHHRARMTTSLASLDNQENISSSNIYF